LTVEDHGSESAEGWAVFCVLVRGVPKPHEASGILTFLYQT
jgi:hypothetical protein